MIGVFLKKVYSEAKSNLFLGILLFNIRIVYVIDLTLNSAITNQVEITTHYDKVINYATFTNTGTSIYK